MNPQTNLQNIFPPPPPPPPRRFTVSKDSNTVKKPTFAGLFFDKIYHPSSSYVFLFDLSKVVNAAEMQVQIEDDQKLVLRIRQENITYRGTIEHIETYKLDADCEVCKTGNINGIKAWTQEDILLVHIPRVLST